jgi:hypothetical protein
MRGPMLGLLAALVACTAPEAVDAPRSRTDTPQATVEREIKRTDRLSVVRVAAIPDSIVGYDLVNGMTQFQRLDARRLALTPLPNSRTSGLAIVDLGTREARVVARQGGGPDELTRWVTLARGGDGAALVLDQEGAGVVKRFDANGRAVQRWRSVRPGYGLAECDGQIFVVASVRRDGTEAWQGGLFELRADGDPVLRHPLPAIGGMHPQPEMPQLADSRGGRLVVAASSRAELHVSDSRCDRMATVRLAVPWFTVTDTVDDALPWTRPAPHVVNGVRWYDEYHASVLLQRPNADARYFTDPASRTGPRAPAGLRPLTETVLVVADVRTGEVVGEAVLARAGWSFVSGRELVARRLDDALDRMDVWAFRVDGLRTR